MFCRNVPIHWFLFFSVILSIGIPIFAMDPPRPEQSSSSGNLTPPRLEQSSSSESLAPPRPEQNSISGYLTPPRLEQSSSSESLTPPRPVQSSSSGHLTPPRLEQSGSSRKLTLPRLEQSGSSENLTPPRIEQSGSSRKLTLSRSEQSGSSGNSMLPRSEQSGSSGNLVSNFQRARAKTTKGNDKTYFRQNDRRASVGGKQVEFTASDSSEGSTSQRTSSQKSKRRLSRTLVPTELFRQPSPPELKGYKSKADLEHEIFSEEGMEQEIIDSDNGDLIEILFTLIASPKQIWFLRLEPIKLCNYLTNIARNPQGYRPIIEKAFGAVSDYKPKSENKSPLDIAEEEKNNTLAKEKDKFDKLANKNGLGWAIRKYISKSLENIPAYFPLRDMNLIILVDMLERTDLNIGWKLLPKSKYFIPIPTNKSAMQIARALTIGHAHIFSKILPIYGEPLNANEILSLLGKTMQKEMSFFTLKLLQEGENWKNLFAKFYQVMEELENMGNMHGRFILLMALNVWKDSAIAGCSPEFTAKYPCLSPNYIGMYYRLCVYKAKKHTNFMMPSSYFTEKLDRLGGIDQEQSEQLLNQLAFSLNNITAHCKFDFEVDTYLVALFSGLPDLIPEKVQERLLSGKRAERLESQEEMLPVEREYQDFANFFASHHQIGTWERLVLAGYFTKDAVLKLCENEESLENKIDVLAFSLMISKSLAHDIIENRDGATFQLVHKKRKKKSSSVSSKLTSTIRSSPKSNPNSSDFGALDDIESSVCISPRPVKYGPEYVELFSLIDKIVTTGNEAELKDPLKIILYNNEKKNIEDFINFVRTKKSECIAFVQGRIDSASAQATPDLTLIQTLQGTLKKLKMPMNMDRVLLIQFFLMVDSNFTEQEAIDITSLILNLQTNTYK
jgi:hypothetical protein